MSRRHARSASGRPLPIALWVAPAATTTAPIAAGAACTAAGNHGPRLWIAVGAAVLGLLLVFAALALFSQIVYVIAGRRSAARGLTFGLTAIPTAVLVVGLLVWAPARLGRPDGRGVGLPEHRLRDLARAAQNPAATLRASAEHELAKAAAKAQALRHAREDYQRTLEAFLDLGGIDAGTLSTLKEIEHRRAALRRCMDARERYDALRLPEREPPLRPGNLAAIRATWRETREVNRRLEASMQEVLDLMEQSLGRRRVRPDGSVVFDSPEAASRYERLLDDIGTHEARLTELSAELLALRTAN